ncbi:MAG TPA: ABC transporter ATP-binding protein, partial [Verrucomicrobiae bacterium]|nr:ABC transporter ATP-binding protein [Verrucomicrobiae bacterium]
KILIDPPNFLLMDEPTTHLDMASIEALITALKQFEGTLVFISHDVYFIKQLANEVVHVEGGRLRKFAGDYTYYVEKTGWGTATSFNTTGPAAPPKKEKPAGPTKEEKRLQAEEKQLRSRARTEQKKVVEGIEKKIADFETRQAEIHAVMQNAEIYSKNDSAVELNRELKEIAWKLEQLHQKWEKEAMKLESLAV